MGGVQSGTHNLGDALWVQERQKQKGNRDAGRYDTTIGHGQSPLCSTQERRKLLKRTRSLAVISEDESSRSPSRGHVIEPSADLRLGYDTSSLQHQRRHQLIPRAKLIDRNTLKDRLSKSQQHLSESYCDRLQDFGPSHRPCQSRSVCGLYSLTPGLNTLPEPLNHRRGTSKQLYEPPERLNILNWPENSPRRYRSVQDLNSVSGLVDIVEDNCWPIEENRSVDCIYTQVKRKRKEHRSLDSILFEDDSDELEYFDILNLLPLSNVRLEINESESMKSRTIPERGVKELFNRETKSNPGIISFSTKDNNWGFEKCSKHRNGVRITEIDDTKNSCNEKDRKSCKNFTISDSLSKASVENGITSFPELAREKRHSERVSDSNDDNLDSSVRKKILKTKPVVESCHTKKERLLLDQKNVEDNLKDSVSANIHEENIQHLKNQSKVEETEDSKSLWISDNEETEEMSRRPQVLKIIDNDVTKAKNFKKSVSLNLNLVNNDETKENICENDATSYQTPRISNKPDLINDHVYESNPEQPDMNEEDKEKMNRLSVENARSFFEKKSADQDLLTNRNNEGRFERIVKETSNILGKACHAVKDSLGFEARSESSDLGLGSEVGSDIRRLSVDENTNVIEEKVNNSKKLNEDNRKYQESEDKNENSFTNLTRSRSCIDSIECQDSDEPEFDHVRYKIVKSHMFGKNIFNTGKKDVTYDGLMQYLREYSFQDLLMDNNVVIIEPVRAEVERKPSFNDSKLKSSSSFRITNASLKKVKDLDSNSPDKKGEKTEFHVKKPPRQSSLRKHFFYQPIRVNRELNDDELPDPDTVRNVRRMFEETLKKKLTGTELRRGDSTRKSVSMKDLRTIDSSTFECGTPKPTEESRSRCSSRAKDLTKMFENIERRKLSPLAVNGNKDDTDAAKNESKTRIIAQAFEARSGLTSPSDSTSSKNRANKYQQRHLHNWDSGSVSSGVSSDYPDTDAGSAPHCTSSEDEELYCHDDDGVDEGHYVSQDVLKKIREYGTSVTYYGGKVINTFNGPLICPMVCKKSKGSKKALDYIKFRLVKSNSCDSRLELTGRLVENRNKSTLGKNRDHGVDLRQLTIDETPSIEITSIEQENSDKSNDKLETKEEKREPPVVIGLEPKKEENKVFKADFKLGKLDDCTTLNRFSASALTRWQINENTWKRNSDFGKMEFEEFEVLEDSLNEVGA